MMFRLAQPFGTAPGGEEAGAIQVSHATGRVVGTSRAREHSPTSCTAARSMEQTA